MIIKLVATPSLCTCYSRNGRMIWRAFFHNSSIIWDIGKNAINLVPWLSFSSATRGYAIFRKRVCVIGSFKRQMGKISCRLLFFPLRATQLPFLLTLSTDLKEFDCCLSWMQNHSFGKMAIFVVTPINTWNGIVVILTCMWTSHTSKNLVNLIVSVSGYYIYTLFDRYFLSIYSSRILP